ncbi:MAG: hypothetical protein AAF490_11750 [Chloroflexota bacterium]
MSQKRSRIGMGLIILAIITGLLFWSELLFSSVPSLLDVPSRASTLGWSVNNARLYFTGLAILDLLGGLGIVLFLIRFIGKDKGARTTAVFQATLIVTVVYAIYQFGIAFALPNELRPVYWIIGIVYVLIALGLRTLYRRSN